MDISDGIASFVADHTALMDGLAIEGKTLNAWQNYFMIRLRGDDDFVSIREKLAETCEKIQVCAKITNKYKTTLLYIENTEKDRVVATKAHSAINAPARGITRAETISRAEINTEFGPKKNVGLLISDFFEKELWSLKDVLKLLSIQASTVMAESKMISNLQVD